jgi:SAM-dependent methyltransferase
MSPPEPIFDRDLLIRRKGRAERMALLAPAPDFLLTRVAEDIAWRLGAVKRQFAQAAVIGGNHEPISRWLRAVANVAAVAEVAESTGETLLVEEASLDLAVSGLSLQWANDLPGTLIQIRRALKPDGLMIAALMGGRTLFELRETFLLAEAEMEGGASPRVAPFADVRDLGGLLQRAGFALPVTDVDTVDVTYADPLALMLELRAMGAGNVLVARRRVPLRRTTLARAIEIYRERHGTANGRVRATFEIVTLTGWAPHESQQKPLRPGSAKTRLADALGTRELPAGEKP